MIPNLSYVDPSAKLAQNVVVEPFVTIGKNVEIGEGSWIGPNVTIMEGAKIGKNCKIFPGAVVSAIPMDLKFAGEESTVEIGDNVIIRECVTVNRGTKYSDTTKIGNNVMLMAYVHVAHDCQIEDHVILANNVNLAGHIRIEEAAIVGGASSVHQFVNIGKHSFISGGSLVMKDVPPYVKAARYPLSYVGVNSIGLRRRGYSAEDIHHIQDIFRVLYVRGFNVTQAINILEAELDATDFRDEIISFIKESKRGIMRGFNRASANNG